MTKNPVKVVIAVVLILLLIRNLFIIFISGINEDIPTGEAIGELIGELTVNAIIALVIFVLLRKDKPKNTEQQP